MCSALNWGKPLLTCNSGNPYYFILWFHYFGQVSFTLNLSLDTQCVVFSKMQMSYRHRKINRMIFKSVRLLIARVYDKQQNLNRCFVKDRGKRKGKCGITRTA